MKKIKSKKHAALAMLCLGLAGLCLALQAAGPRYLLSALLLLALAAVNGLRALARPGMLEEAARYADERDRLLALQASRTALRLLNGLLTAGCFAALVLYGALRRPELLAVGLTLCAVLVLLFVLLLAAVILKEPITRKKSFGVFMGVSGGLLLVFSSTHAIDSISSLDGDMMMIVSGLMYAIYLVLSKPLSLRYSSVTMMKWMFLFTTLTLVPFTFRHVLDAPAFHREVWDFTELGAIFYVLFGATFLPYLLIPMSLKRIRPTTVSMYNYVQPIVASFIAVMIGQDTLSWQKVLSAVLVFTGVYLVTQSKSREDMEKGKR